jgi:uncharacterized protein YdhG (YjbR/CyaY superfamily)
MPPKKRKPTTIDEYIAQCPGDAQPILQKIRAVIKKAAPRAEEKISYDMVGFYLNGGLVWFGAFKDHIGFYPRGSAIDAFKGELAPYLRAKATLQFPLAQPIPYAGQLHLILRWPPGH